MSSIKHSIPGLLVLAGCGTSVNTMMLRPTAPMTPRPAGQVEMFVSGPPARPYQDIARIEAHDPVVQTTIHMMEKLREEAGRLGCDGLIVDPVDPYDPHHDRHHTTDLAGVCIAFTP